jgi:hypothetical protein
MKAAAGSGPFYAGIPVFRGFGSLMDPALYSPLPDGWVIGVADIVESTRAIAEQRYKAVNMAGAAVIAAVTNALEEREFPFRVWRRRGEFRRGGRRCRTGACRARRHGDLGEG